MNNRDLKKQLIEEFQQLQMEDIKDELLSQLSYVQFEKPKQAKPKLKKSFKYAVTSFVLVTMMIICIVGININQNQFNGLIVSFDVNPNIELKVNDENRIIDYSYHNEEGKQVLDDMDLIDTDIDVAVNAIIGSMFRHGYIDEIKNSVLVTVLGDDDNNRKALKEKIANEVKEILSGYSIEASVVSQDIGYSSEIEKLANDYNISMGKATLIQELISENPSYEFSDLTSLSISDLNTLVHYQNIEFKTITIDGMESHDGYLNDETLKELVLNHAKVNENEITNYQSNLDCKDSRLLFVVSFQDAFATYNYQVNAISGEIISFNVDVNV